MTTMTETASQLPVVTEGWTLAGQEHFADSWGPNLQGVIATENAELSTIAPYATPEEPVVVVDPELTAALEDAKAKPVTTLIAEAAQSRVSPEDHARKVRETYAADRRRAELKAAGAAGAVALQ